MKFTLEQIPQPLTIIRLPSGSDIPTSLYQQSFYSLTVTAQEISIISSETLPIHNDAAQYSSDWRGLKVSGTMEHDLVGVMATLSSDIAAIDVSLFAFSTFDTDYLLVKQENLDNVITQLRRCGHFIKTAH